MPNATIKFDASSLHSLEQTLYNKQDRQVSAAQMVAWPCYHRLWAVYYQGIQDWTPTHECIY